MYRTAAKRLITGVTSGRNSIARLRLPSPSTFVDHSFFSTATNSQEFPNSQIPNQHHIRQETPISSDSASSSSSTWSKSTAGEESRSHESRRPRVEYQEEQVRVLQAALSHVVRALISFHFQSCIQLQLKVMHSQNGCPFFILEEILSRVPYDCV